MPENLKNMWIKSDQIGQKIPKRTNNPKNLKWIIIGLKMPNMDQIHTQHWDQNGPKRYKMAQKKSKIR